MFVSKNQVRMHDTDMAGILYFPRQFRFANDALEEMMESEGINFQKLFTEGDVVFVVVHVEADYKVSLHIGDKVDVHASVAHIGNSSFSFQYGIFRNTGEHVGSAQTVHVSIDRVTRKKCPIPEILLKILHKHVSHH